MTALALLYCGLVGPTADAWELLGGTWRIGDQLIEQQSPDGGHMAFLKGQLLADVDLSSKLPPEVWANPKACLTAHSSAVSCSGTTSMLVATVMAWPLNVLASGVMP